MTDQINTKFKKNSGCYKCEECGKQTRETGLNESQVGLCRNCYEVMEDENSESDDE